MPTWYDTSALDALLEKIAGKGAYSSGEGANEIRLLKLYGQGDTYAVVDSNSIAWAAISPTDFSGPEDVTSPNGHRKIDFLGKSGMATITSSGTDLHIALVDTANSVVLAVTNETSDQAITASNNVTFPQFYMQSSQPTQL
jgi:hypothetical protein